MVEFEYNRICGSSMFGSSPSRAERTTGIAVGPRLPSKNLALVGVLAYVLLKEPHSTRLIAHTLHYCTLLQ